MLAKFYSAAAAAAAELEYSLVGRDVDILHAARGSTESSDLDGQCDLRWWLRVEGSMSSADRDNHKHTP